ncbi:hypothetical protein PW5551_05550 [Petrotoga sp. 9PW.55.5.1]|jgi:dephospho-CoA kinase|uniref:dephospho-CoA kinase n=1 Tax=Petrotoga sp. 9PW.55.5.1 TaxID=1308979 RepID=UPI000DC3F643|nr:dephospho-CoA kinase [Petrotoga sp. 9PW.55.5.1]RAO99146.1 hypothetical protein PW5551_05550 [Petrotoga sp. 9PW.55.5.1]
MVIGITGPAGSGKSTVSKLIKKILNNKVCIIDVDRVGHEVLALFLIKKKLREVFGEKIFDNEGNISRVKLGNIVFSDKEKLEILNQTVHPAIFKKTREILKKSLKKSDIIILDAALLHKIGLDKLCDKIILVESTKQKRIERLIDKRGVPKEKAEKIVNSQNLENLGYYDFKIYNEEDINKLYKEVAKIVQKFQGGVFE